MIRSTDRIITTHAGSLPRPERLWRAWASPATGPAHEKELDALLKSSVADVVRAQLDAGVDVAQRWRVRQADALRLRSRGLGRLHFRPDQRFRPGAARGGGARARRRRRADAHRHAAARAAQVRGVLRRSRRGHAPGRAAGLHRADQIYRRARAAPRPRQPEGGRERGGREGSIRHLDRGRQPRNVLPRPERRITRTRRHFSRASPMRSRSSIARSSMPASCSSSTIPGCPTPGTCSIRRRASRSIAAIAALRIEALNHALRASPRTGCAITSAGAAGTARTPPTFRCATSSTSCCR